ncbi:MAG: flagellar brake protein [Betaproteobacteria bacterium]|nr:flagellar brake protein [Betaproteobacteria bacterium]
MNLQPVAIEEIPIGKPLPWQLYSHEGYTVFARGERIADAEQLKPLIANGLLRDVDALPQDEETEIWEEAEGTPLNTPFPPPGIRAQTGERVQLRILGRDIQAFYYAQLIGYIRNQTILVTAPLDGGQRVIMTEGERVEVRMLTGSNIHIFQSMIQRVCISPSYYMHLEYPAKVRTQPLRKSPWAKMALTASVTDAQGNQETARIINLSPDGAQIHISRSMGGKNDSLRLTLPINIDDLKTTLTLDTLIEHVRPAKVDRRTDETNMMEYGISFNNTPTEDTLWLKCLIYQRIAEGHLG